MRFPFIAMIFLGIVTACTNADGNKHNAAVGNTNDPGSVAALSELGFALSVVKNNYIEPLDSRALLILALRGIERQPSSASNQVQSIVESAIVQIQAMQPDDMALSDNRPSENFRKQLEIFANAVVLVGALPNAPSTQSTVQAAIVMMLDGIDPLSHYEPPSIMQGQPDVDTYTQPGFAYIADIDSPARIHMRKVPFRGSAVFSTVIGDVVYMRVTALPAGTTFDIKKRFLMAEAQTGGHVRSVILDLRFNGGGLLDESVDVARLFLPHGSPIAKVIGRNPQKTAIYTANSNDITGGLPIVVLVNTETSNGAEIVAGSLQCDHRAVLLGSVTSGYGYVSTVIPFPDGGLVSLTTGQIILPSGWALQSGGITPDIVLQEQTGVQPGIFGLPPAGEPVDDQNVQYDFEIKQALKFLTRN